MSAKVLERFFWQRFLVFRVEAEKVLFIMKHEGVPVAAANNEFIASILYDINMVRPLADVTDHSLLQIVLDTMNVVLVFLNRQSVCRSRQSQELVIQYIASMRFTMTLLTKVIDISAVDDAQTKQALFDAACTMPYIFWYSIIHSITETDREYYRHFHNWRRHLPDQYYGYEPGDYDHLSGRFAILPATNPLNYVTPAEIASIGELLVNVADRDRDSCHSIILDALKNFYFWPIHNWFRYGKTTRNQVGQQFAALLEAVGITLNFEFDAITSPGLAQHVLESSSRFVEPFIITTTQNHEYSITLPSDFPI
jgi:hypothetical protein